MSFKAARDRKTLRASWTSFQTLLISLHRLSMACRTGTAVTHRLCNGNVTSSLELVNSIGCGWRQLHPLQGRFQARCKFSESNMCRIQKPEMCGKGRREPTISRRDLADSHGLDTLGSMSPPLIRHALLPERKQWHF